MAFNLFGSKKETKKPAIKKTETAITAVVSDTSVHQPAASTVLDSIYVSEKSSVGQAQRKYVFRVNPGASKSEIKKQVSTRYGVTVQAVHTIHLPKKKKTVGRNIGWSGGAHKAIVTLAEGQTIEQAKA